MRYPGYYSLARQAKPIKLPINYILHTPIFLIRNSLPSIFNRAAQYIIMKLLSSRVTSLECQWLGVDDGVVDRDRANGANKMRVSIFIAEPAESLKSMFLKC